MKSLVYTRSGDAGKTSLIGGTRVAKTDIRLEAYGTVDELSAQLGLLATYLTQPQDQQMVMSIQHRLFAVGAYLATDPLSGVSLPQAKISTEMIAEIEQEIDRIDAQLPPLKRFVLPGGCRAAAVAHVCRTVCRRCERRILSLAEMQKIEVNLTAYINRISDYLFVLSRKLNIDAKKEEIFWDNGCK